ncbi:MAG: hypothetical protein ACK5OX_09775 [Desertimonas sp.]
MSVVVEPPPWEPPRAPERLLGELATRGGEVEDDADLLLLRARCHQVLGRYDLVRGDLERANDLLADDLGPRGRWARVWTAAFVGGVQLDHDWSEALASSVAATAQPSSSDLDLACSALAMQVLASCDALRKRWHEADLRYQLACRLWDRLGSRDNVTRVVCERVQEVLLPTGRFLEAGQAVDEVLACPVDDALVGRVRLLRGSAALWGGELVDAETHFAVVARLGAFNATLRAWADWGRAIIALRRRDTATGTQAADQAMRQVRVVHASVPWFASRLSIELGACGELELAERYLAEAAEIDPDGSEVSTARFVLDARRGISGDLDAVLAGSEPAVWPRLLLVGAHAAAMAGDVQLAGELYRGAAERADLGRLGEPAALETVRLLTAGPGASGGEGAWQVRVFGPASSLVIDPAGELVVVSSGREAALLAAVALAGGELPVEQAAEALWPGEPAGSTRLWNVLSRHRNGLNLLERRDDRIRLRAGVWSDGVEFWTAARRAVADIDVDPDRAAIYAAQATGWDVSEIVPHQGFWWERAVAKVRAEARELAAFAACRPAGGLAERAGHAGRVSA